MPVRRRPLRRHRNACILRRSAALKKIYVGNLSFQTDETKLEALFTPFGAVKSAAIIRDRFSGDSRGFGFVEMDDDAQAQAAIDALNSTEFEGRNLTVNEARPPAPKTGGGGFRGGNREGGGGGYRGGGGGGGYRAGGGGYGGGGGSRSSGESSGYRGGREGGRRDFNR
ncbi:MAG: RNA-binding protein [Deltaproteobacteria bacterium]|nr:RNA-binding protein [Deltaproteobacteria bacterium]